MKPVLCLGDVCIDILIPYASAQTAKVQMNAERAQIEAKTYAGGSVANTACSLSRLSIPVMFAGTCGSDAFGYMLKHDFESEGVDTSLLRLDNHLSTQLVILVLNEKGDRTAFACPAHHGSQHAILPNQLPDDIASRISWLHVSGMMLREDPAASVQLSLMRSCSAHGIPVSLDVNVRVESFGDDFFRRNLNEAKKYATFIFGSAVNEIPLLADLRDAETSAISLAKAGATVIARSGEQGSVLFEKDLRVHVPAFQVTVSDTVGAGDVFNGAFIAAKLRGCDSIDATRYANGASAICVSKQGARSGPTQQELDLFLQSCMK